jgi:hypothetical protein
MPSATDADASDRAGRVRPARRATPGLNRKSPRPCAASRPSWAWLLRSRLVCCARANGAQARASWPLQTGCSSVDRCRLPPARAAAAGIVAAPLKGRETCGTTASGSGMSSRAIHHEYRMMRGQGRGPQPRIQGPSSIAVQIHRITDANLRRCQRHPAQVLVPEQSKHGTPEWPISLQMLRLRVQGRLLASSGSRTLRGARGLS